MKCPICNHINSQNAKFCDQCGSALNNVSTLRHENTKDFYQKEHPYTKHNPAPRSAERRQLTILFCDLVGSTPLSERLDPEDYRQVILNYQNVAEKVVRRYGGHIAQYLGDGLLVYFGYPQGLEDAPMTAVRTGLGILEAVGHANQQWLSVGKTTIEIRIGVHTGLVVVDDHLALGEATNIAARLEGLAPHNGLVISPQTWKLVQGWFEVKSIGIHELKGISRPMEIFHVLRESGAKTRLEVAKIKGLSPLLARENELQSLREGWAKAKKNSGNLIVIKGEAGIGKSRLVDAIKEEISIESNSWLTEIRCSYYYQNSAFYPVIELLENVVLQYSSEESEVSKLNKLEGFILQSGLEMDTALPLFAELLSIPLNEIKPLNLTPQSRKQLIISHLIQALLHRASVQPVLLVLEDLHWADASTIEWINKFFNQLGNQAIFAICTARPGFQTNWGGLPYSKSLTINHLSPEEVVNICHFHAKGKTLPKEILQLINNKTEGVPLFVEELTKMILESGMLVEKKEKFEIIGAIPTFAIPSTLQDSLLARLDQSSDLKELIQSCAVLEREFSFDFLKALLVWNENQLNNALNKLSELELLRKKKVNNKVVYLFKHALIQDAAYESMLKAHRQKLHLRVARILNDQFQDKHMPHPELLAHHYTEAAVINDAIPLWLLAGQKAAERSANIEAVNHFKKGVELLKALPTTQESIHYELEFQTALGLALMATKGFASLEVKQTYHRARELCYQLGDKLALFSTLWGLWYYYAVLPHEQTAQELGEQLLNIAQESQDDTLKMVAYRALGAVLACKGEFFSASMHLKKGLAYFNPNQHHQLTFLYGQEIGLISREWLAFTLWFIGYPNQALKMSLDTIQMAREVNHPGSLIYVLYFSAKIFQFCHRGEQVSSILKECVALATSQDNPVFFSASNVLYAKQMADEGQIEAGTILLLESLNSYRSTGAELFTPYFLTLLAGIHQIQGQYEQGLTTINEALAISEKTGELMWEPEIYRIKGELMRLKTNHELEAEECFFKSLEIAQHQNAKSWELRTVNSLCQLWIKQGKLLEAHTLLNKTYTWFTEGFDSLDLLESQALLSFLSSSQLNITPD